MPALPPVPNVLKVILKFQAVADVDIINIFHFLYAGGPPNDTQLSAVAAAVPPSWATNIAGAVNNGISLTEVTAIDLSSSTAATGVWTGDQAGTNATPALPLGTAMVISKKISRRYRGGHPRFYVCGLTEQSLQNGQNFTSTAVTNMQNGWLQVTADTVAAINSQGMNNAKDVNVSYYHGFTNVLYPSGRYRAVPTVRAVPVVDAIVAYEARSKIGSQRRRNQYAAA